MLAHLLDALGQLCVKPLATHPVDGAGPQAEYAGAMALGLPIERVF